MRNLIVGKEKYTEGLTKVISDMCEKPSANKKLFQSKMEEDGLVAVHLNKFNTVFNQLSSIKI